MAALMVSLLSSRNSVTVAYVPAAEELSELSELSGVDSGAGSGVASAEDSEDEQEEDPEEDSEDDPDLESPPQATREITIISAMTADRTRKTVLFMYYQPFRLFLFLSF